MANTKRALLTSVMSIVLCVVMLLGSTFAWFTDNVTSAGNIIKSGALDVELAWADGKENPNTTTAWKDASEGAIFNYDMWEPGYTEVRHVKISNAGSLALKYEIRIAATGTVSELANVIDVYYIKDGRQITARTDLTDADKLGTLAQVLANPYAAKGNLQAVAGSDVDIATIALKMQENAGNQYQNKSIGSQFTIQLVATQDTVESDSFDNKYDAGAEYKEYKANTIYINDVEQAAGTTIQSAIDSAADGAVITLGAGTYTEALAIENKNITIKGSGATFITFDANTAVDVFDAVNGESLGYNGIITAKDSTLTLENLTVKGNIEAAYPKMYSYRYAGVFALDSDVTMTNCCVEDIRSTDTYFGVQNGNSIYAVSSTPKTLTLNNVTINNFQKTGVLTRENVTLNMNGGSITGIGKTNLIAQNGIQYSGPATIKNIKVSDIYYIADSSAVALFAYPINDAASTIDNVKVYNCQYDITVYSKGTVTVTNSNIEKIETIADGATLTIDGVPQS